MTAGGHDDPSGFPLNLDQPANDADEPKSTDPVAEPMAKLAREAAPQLPKRFYKDVAVESATAPASATSVANGPAYAITLDGRPVKTPGKQPLAVPYTEVAEAIADEWRAQGEHIDPQTMPVTRLTNTILDGIAVHADRVRDEIVQYAGSDLLCYRATSPAGLTKLQQTHWDPVLAWAADRFGHTFILATGIMPVAQPEALLAEVRGALADFDAYQLGAAHVVMTLSGSSVLALALSERHLSADAVWTAAHVDEDWQISQWGEDSEAATRRAKRRLEFDAAALVLGASPR